MTVKVHTAGDQLTVLDTPATLATITDPGVYQCVVDISVLNDAQDILVIRVYGKADSDTTERLRFQGTYTGANVEGTAETPMFMSPHHLKFEIEQRNGAVATFEWAVYQDSNEVDLVSILGTALTETAGQIAAGFKKFFDIATPGSTMDRIVLVDTATVVSNKTGYALSTAGILAIWHQLTSAIATIGSIGVLFKNTLDTAISSRQESGPVDLNPDQSAVTIGTVIVNDDMRGTDLANQTTPPTVAAIRTEIDTNSTQLATIVAFVDGIMPAKNADLANVEFLMVDSSDHVTPAPGLTITTTRSIDSAAFGAKHASTTVVEVGNGIYALNANAADLNGDIITFLFAATGADDRFLTIRTAG